MTGNPNNLVTLSKNLVVNGGDDSQIIVSTSHGATSPGASLINDPYQNKFVLQLNGSDRINVGPNLITLNGSVACGAMTLDSILNLTTTGLAPLCILVFLNYKVKQETGTRILEEIPNKSNNFPSLRSTHRCPKPRGFTGQGAPAGGRESSCWPRR